MKGVSKYENDIVSKIKNSSNPNKKISEHIKEIKGEKTKRRKTVIYNNIGLGIAKR